MAGKGEKGMYFCGLDVGGTKTAISLGKKENDKINTLKRIEVKTTTPVETINELLKSYNEWIKEFEIFSIGISCGGPLDIENGKILNPPNLLKWENFEIVDYVKKNFKVDAYIENDANACALSEYKYGAGIGYKNMVFLTFGTGLGAGIIINGNLYSGSNGNAGEIGHISLRNSGPEGYGKRGSFEGFSSGSGIKKLAAIMLEKSKIENKDKYRNLPTRELAKLAHEGDKFALSVFNRSGKMLGEGLSIIIDVLNPEVIVLGGVFMRSGDLLIKSMYKEINKKALPISSKIVKIVPAKLSENIGDFAALTIAEDGYEKRNK